ncbi:probable serine/threonine-protein kinase clkA [Liolophura sinensis]|uniref:probable serine/threonine-protein kinase clkA n=1 Tax=Liolophura sinensis TaxID=3198878 RepID=UPI0031584915
MGYGTCDNNDDNHNNNNNSTANNSSTFHNNSTFNNHKDEDNNNGEDNNNDEDNSCYKINDVDRNYDDSKHINKTSKQQGTTRKRKRHAETENPTPNIHFSNDACGAGGERQPVDRPSAAAHNQNLEASNGSGAAERLPDVTHRKEREQNRLNGACVKDSGEWRDSQNPYDTIPFDEDLGEEKSAVSASEYLHAKALRRQDKGMNLDSLQRPRSTEENAYSNAVNLDMGESAWEDAESGLHQPTWEASGKQLDGYLSPSQIARPVSGVSSNEDMTYSASGTTPQASGNDTLTVFPLSERERNNAGTLFGIDTLSANRHNHENLYQPMFGSDT